MSYIQISHAAARTKAEVKIQSKQQKRDFLFKFK